MLCVVGVSRYFQPPNWTNGHTLENNSKRFENIFSQFEHNYVHGLQIKGGREGLWGLDLT